MKVNRTWKHHWSLFVVLVILELLEDYVFSGLEGLKHNFEFKTLCLEFTFFLSCTVLYFVNFKWASPKFLKSNRIGVFIVSVLFLLVVFSTIRFFLQEVVLQELFGFGNYNLEKFNTITYFMDNAYFGIKPILYSTVVFLMISNTERQEQNLRLQLDKKKAELDLMRSQISPHFLFNTLNSFYVELIDDKPKTANNIQRLSELLRYVIRESNEDFVALADEIKFIKEYVYFFSVRYEDNLALDFKIDGRVGNQKIPPLMLIHFVENVFKHGLVTQKQCPAVIIIKILENKLSIETKNKIDESKTKLVTSGIGFNNMNQRLVAMYNSDQYFVKSQVEKDCYNAFLSLPL